LLPLHLWELCECDILLFSNVSLVRVIWTKLTTSIHRVIVRKTEDVFKVRSHSSRSLMFILISVVLDGYNC